MLNITYIRVSSEKVLGELTYAQAAAVTSMGTQFKSNKTITVFHELKYFSTLNTLSAEAFRDTTSLRYITLPGSLRTIGNYAFLNSGLYELEFNEGLTTLNNNQIIWECASLARVTYPSTITSIAGINAATHNNNLTAVISFAKTPPSFSSTTYIVGYTYFYVPNESLKAYRLKASWSSYDGRVLGFFSGPSNFYKDGTYTYSLRSIFNGYTDLQFSLEQNDYVTMSVVDGSAVLECSGITQDTESEAHLSYSFVYKGRTVSGTIDIPIAYKEIIQFEDAAAKSLCVANWGGEYCASSNLYGVPNEITMEQAAVVRSFGTVFSGNNNFYSDDNALQYFGCMFDIFEPMFLGTSSGKNVYGGTPDSGDFTIPFHKVSPNDSITFYKTYTLFVYRKDFIYCDWWGPSGVRTLTLTNTNSYLIRLSIKKADKDIAYVKNNTTGEYIYKGANVP